MSDLISRTWLLDVVENIIEWDTERDRNRIIHQVRELTPTRKKGRWLAIGNTGLAVCECGFITDRYYTYNYCPNCGSKMKGESDGEIH